jgi:hypothetical protein
MVIKIPVPIIIPIPHKPTIPSISPKSNQAVMLAKIIIEYSKIETYVTSPMR